MSETSSDSTEPTFETLAAQDRNTDYYSSVGERVLQAIHTENGSAAETIRSLIQHRFDIAGSAVRHIINSRVRSLFSPEQDALAEAAIWRECGDDAPLNAIAPPGQKKV